GRIFASTGLWEFFDVDNRPVSLDAVRAHPERIGAVYFVDDRPFSGACGGSFGCAWLKDTQVGPGGQIIAGSGAPYREYFVPNEAMVESWSARTPGLRDELLRAIAMLDALRKDLIDSGCRAPGGSFEAWRGQVLQSWPRTPANL